MQDNEVGQEVQQVTTENPDVLLSDPWRQYADQHAHDVSWMTASEREAYEYGMMHHAKTMQSRVMRGDVAGEQDWPSWEVARRMTTGWRMIEDDES